MISQIYDELATVGETVSNAYLGRTTLNGFLEKWTSFIKEFISQENHSNSERPWNDFIQEKTREEALHSRQLKGEEDEENISLASGVRKGKWATELNTRGEESSHDGKKKKDMSKVKIFTCQKTGHYASHYPRKKNGKGKKKATVSVNDEEEFAT
jgi:hypothetical protein